MRRDGGVSAFEVGVTPVGRTLRYALPLEPAGGLPDGLTAKHLDLVFADPQREVSAIAR